MSHHNQDEQQDVYKVPTKVDINDILERDKDDEALENYKKQLLGQGYYAPANDARRVVIVEMHVIFKDCPTGDVVFKELDKMEKLELLKDKNAITFKEGCLYKLKFVFRVQHDIVTGLRYLNKVTKNGIKLAKEELMLGSYPPQETTHDVIWPRNGWEEAPSGFIARGTYKSIIRFIDDDDVLHLSFEYSFNIKKDWHDASWYVYPFKTLQLGQIDHARIDTNPIIIFFVLDPFNTILSFDNPRVQYGCQNTK